MFLHHLWLPSTPQIQQQTFPDLQILGQGRPIFFYGYNRFVAWFVGRTVKITVQSLTGYIQIHNLQMWLRAADWTPMV
jgi:hypothetical protein